MQVPHDDDTSITHMVAAADATADSTMHREYVVDTNISNYRVMKVLPDTGSTSSNFVEDEIAAWIELVERKLSSNCYLPSNMHHQPTTVSMTWNGAHTVVSNKNEMFNLLLFNKLKQTTELLPCLIARTILTSIDLIIGLPTIRKHDLVLKIHWPKMLRATYPLGLICSELAMDPPGLRTSV